jgi:hypothetical protein
MDVLVSAKEGENIKKIKNFNYFIFEHAKKKI